MANKKPVNKDNPKNIYCGHCKHFANSGTSWLGCQVMICGNKNSKHYQCQRYYKWAEYGKDYEPYCNHWKSVLYANIKDDDFCSYGERRTDG